MNNRNKKWIEYADCEKGELLGVDSVRPYDNRHNNESALIEAQSFIQRQAKKWLSDKRYVKPVQCYARITRGIKGNPITQWRSLENPLFK